METRDTKPDLGSCIETAPGVWRLRVYVGDGRHRSRTVHCDTEGEAWWHLDRLVSEAHTEAGTLADLMARWLAMKEHDLSPTTMRGYRQATANYLVPVLGHMHVGKIRGRHLDQLYQDMLEGRRSRSGAPLNPATVRQVHAVIRGALGQAVRWEMVPANVALAASPPKLRKYELEPPSVAQISAAFEAIEHDPHLTMFLRLAATTGARRGEVCALRWSDFDLTSMVVTIAHSVVDLSGEALTVKGTKTGGVKRLALDARTVDMLTEYRAQQVAQAKRNRTRLVADPYLFVGRPDGSVPWRPNTVTLAWSRLRKRAGLPETVRLHDLRHALATRMLAAGDDIRTVSGRLGHADPSTTLRIYAHWVPERDRAAADRIGEEF